MLLLKERHETECAEGHDEVGDHIDTQHVTPMGTVDPVDKLSAKIFCLILVKKCVNTVPTNFFRNTDTVYLPPT